MELIRGIENLRKIGDYPLVTLGNYDGLHTGHLKIISALLQRKAEVKGSKSILFTFDPHPFSVLPEREPPKLLIEFEDKIKLLENIGIDAVVCVDFTDEFSRIEPEEFVTGILVNRLCVKEIFVGSKFFFGKGKKGDISLLKNLGDVHGFSVHPIGELTQEGLEVSSSRIRRLIADGMVDEAGKLLGREYFFKGNVIKGAGRGRKLGYPTANLPIPKTILPKDGIYAVTVSLTDEKSGTDYPAVCYIGNQPTFGGVSKVIEIHIPGLNMELYGRNIKVNFVKRVRDDMRFDSVKDLTAQIEEDIRKALYFIANS